MLIRLIPKIVLHEHKIMLDPKNSLFALFAIEQ